jgi:hypothetical protein
MTIIAVKAGIMAADSVVRTGDLIGLVAFPKIIRLPDGRLIGTAGSVVDCYAMQQWFLAGEPTDRPWLYGTRTENNEVDILMLRPDGSCWRNGVAGEGFYPQPNPTTIGSYNACLVAEAAMKCGRSAEQAIGVVCEMLAGFGGPVQVERISRSGPSFIPLDIRHGERFDQAVDRVRSGRMEP